MRPLKTALLAAAGLAVLIQPVLAAPVCATVTDLAALRAAAIQQQLMVAALTCHDVESYNRFVLSYQPELQKSDADLKAFFIRGGSEAAYDTFKTRLANLSSLSDIANGPAYCATAAAAFDVALKSRQSLDSFVADQRLMIAMPEQTLCAAPVQTAAAPPPLKVASARPLTKIRVAALAPKPVAVETEVVGVPAHALPASPFGAAQAAPAPIAYEPARDRDEAYDKSARNSDDDLPLPPRPPRSLRFQQREDYYRSIYANQPPDDGGR